MIGIIDYGAGNLFSVKKALKYLGADCKVIETAADFNNIERLILPGVGVFDDALLELKRRDLYTRIKDWLTDDRPYLGICLGLQLLYEESEEAAGEKGFAVLPGKVKRFRRFKVPQIGWNQISVVKESKLFYGINAGLFFYFLHSYYVPLYDSDTLVAKTEYGVEFVSAINRGRIYAVQFHPEKSGEEGLALLWNWIERC